MDRSRPPHVAQPQPAVHSHCHVGSHPGAGVHWNCWPNPSIADEPERIALDLFDRLRLREPFAHSFMALGFDGEEAWRVAARIKVVLLTGAGVGRCDKEPEMTRPSTMEVISAPTKKDCVTKPKLL